MALVLLSNQPVAWPASLLRSGTLAGYRPS